MVGLKTYKVKDKETYDELHNLLNGIAFFRKTDNEFFIKSPNNKVIEYMVGESKITFLHQPTVG